MRTWCVFLSKDIHTCIHACIHPYIHAYIHKIYILLEIIHTYIYAHLSCIDTHYIHTDRHICIHIPTYIHTYVHTYIKMDRQTQTTHTKTDHAFIMQITRVTQKSSASLARFFPFFRHSTWRFNHTLQLAK
jgi:hypothetical protein